jgi:Domain of unknown function (DUF4328)/Protein of unknown function (DUF2510)
VSVPAVPPPGWYHDPYMSAGLRWWDGREWTPHALLPEKPPMPQVPLPPYAGRNERIGRLAMLLWAPVHVLYAGVLGYGLARVIRDAVTFAETAQGSPDAVPFAGDSVIWMTLASLSGLLMWLPLMLLIVWAHRCATTAAALGMPAEHEPVWAVVGWIVPVINFWFPYQSVRDCLPPDHPARRDVLRWWFGYLAVGVGGPVLVILALIDITAFMVALVIVAVLAAATMLVGLRVVEAINAAHRATLAGRPSQA